MLAKEVRQRYIDFFVNKHGHKQIAGASLIPENDPTVLFTTAGMHPLVPYLLGEKHPAGKRLVNHQKCVRTDDIDEVGDICHLTFFEMLGNWSLGDYFKKEAIEMSFDFLTCPADKGGLGLDSANLCVSCFEGDKDAPKDDEAAAVWESLGFKRHTKGKPLNGGQIWFYAKKDNWWGPAGQTGPCGPDTEMFYDTGKPKCPLCDTKGPSCECRKYIEIWNDVFMQYNKNDDGSFSPLKQQNVDTGLGLERVVALLQGVKSPFETELFKDAIDKIYELAGIKGTDETAISVRIIADHLRAAVFILGDKFGVAPSNTDQGYILRRLIRRAIRHGKKLGIAYNFTDRIALIYIDFYKDVYPELEEFHEKIITELQNEEEKFMKTLIHGEKEFEKMLPNLLKNKEKILPGRLAFKLFDTYGFPIEMTEELAKENGLKTDKQGYIDAYKKHQELSRCGAEQKFAGGLADHSEATTKLHTATHLLHKALIMVLGDHVAQKGSNITVDRLRFDFSHPDKMTDEQLKKVENIVNEQIKRALEIKCEEMTVSEAKEKGAIGLFESKYGDRVKVYTVGDFSMEICGGPHVQNTSELKSFKILKEQSSSSGIRRIKAVIG
ncbi:alanine--tRNA ligase [Candidatus Peregrinibacteria bacterium]|nr:alanine--tRNA ligase [Candidatus Peregrinibacteria bacterium]